jgi:hypothetical protein
MAIDPRHIINLKGKDFILFAGLLNCGHEAGLLGIETEVVETLSDPKEQSWVVRAIGRFKSGEGDVCWSAYGDASPASSQMRGAYLRHAETRAVARMLRMATNVGMTAFEELGPDAEATTTGTGSTGARVREQGGERRPNERIRSAESRGDRAANPPASASADAAAVAPVEFCENCGVQIDDPRIVVLAEQKFGKCLCVTCGKQLLAVERARIPTGEIAA